MCVSNEVYAESTPADDFKLASMASLRCSGVCSTSGSSQPWPHRHQLQLVSQSRKLNDFPSRSSLDTVSSGICHHTFAQLVLRLPARPVTCTRRPLLRVCCTSRPSNSRRPGRGWPPWDWFQRFPSLPSILLNVLGVCLLMRIWPLHGKSPLGNAQTGSVQVPFSTFVQHTNQQQISAVTVDGTHLTYSLRPDADLIQSLPESAQSVKIAFQTTRPADYAMPYDTLLKNGIQFGAVETQHNWMLTIMVS